MALLAPRMSLSDDVDANGYWRPAPWGGYGVSSWSAVAGEVSQEKALTLSAVWAATRIHTETFATLPASIIRRVGKKREDAPLHRLWRAIAGRPNPEQSSYVWRIQNEHFRLNWGNSFNEIQEDTEGRVWLWPIHPSRIPPENIKRAGRKNRGGTSVGAPGEMIYVVNNNDGSKTEIPKSQMLHIPGVLPENGLYGRSIIAAGAASLGISLAQERSVESFHGNGMTSRIVLRHPGRLSPEKAAELRSQWQTVYGSSGKGYKAVVLEQGMEVDTLTISPRDAQLIDSRKFGVLEVARWYRLPPHKLAELGRATWANIESQNLEYVQDAVLPTVVCWEQELARQLLREDEQDEFSIKYNLKGLLRADSVVRMAGYDKLFGMRAISPNEIRSLEDMDPIEGGDRYYLATNNYTAVDDEGLPIMPEPDPNAAPVGPADDEDDSPTEQAVSAGRLMERNAETANQLRAAGRDLLAGMWGDLIAYEVRSVRGASERPETFVKWATDFYDGKFLKAAANIVTRLERPVGRLGGAFSRQPMEYGFDSLKRLEGLYGVPMGQFAEAVKAETETWARRAEQFADDVMGRTE